MPAWPTFSTTPMRSTGRSRSAPRSDAQAMQALRAWYVRTRNGDRPDHSMRAVDAALAQLTERERRAVDLWLGGAADARIEELVGLPPPSLGVLRLQLLADVAERLRRRPPAPRHRHAEAWVPTKDCGPL